MIAGDHDVELAAGRADEERGGRVGSADVGAARAAYFPRIGLTATAGVSSGELSSLFERLGEEELRLRKLYGEARGDRQRRLIKAMIRQVAANPGQPAMSLAKVASGGELSRISLAIQVIAAGSNHVPSLVFDEVDSGIGGATADAVGERLQRLARDYQVLVVTHSPQVAARAAHHLLRAHAAAVVVGLLSGN